LRTSRLDFWLRNFWELRVKGAGTSALSNRRLGQVNAAGRRYAAPSIMTIIEMEGPLIGRWPTEGSLL